ncbi:MAG: hypothetical protein AABZ80_05310 [Gemmatimonadota bacterium]
MTTSIRDDWAVVEEGLDFDWGTGVRDFLGGVTTSSAGVLKES